LEILEDPSENKTALFTACFSLDSWFANSSTLTMKATHSSGICGNAWRYKAKGSTLQQKLCGSLGTADACRVLATFEMPLDMTPCFHVSIFCVSNSLMIVMDGAERRLYNLGHDTVVQADMPRN
jgi:hypothetical protein